MKNLDFVQQIQELLEANEKPLTFEEARAFLRVSKSTLYKLTHKKLIPFSKPGGKVLYFKKVDLINWMNSNPVKSDDQIDEVATNYVTFK
jgi:excisionase family DNA binding protein